ncbi:nudix hydrolase 10-like [Olea europaea subsp. europaea]|uniref:Nudix hydrolase 10-like n=1 Tax=Olea europaea subsp. europaea TaxID=158383 RepID=A0A8S0RHJ3_OLEEU|nr:nudix hydrolase 10-like [Olea europaea subsp. europaea]
MEQTIVENGVPEIHLLPAREDAYGGVVVEMEKPMDPNSFCKMLRASLLQWKLQGKKGVWIKLPIQLANLVEIAVKEGFWYHHTEPHYLMLVYWIPETNNAIPPNATHRVRIGAIVLNDKRELLVVREKYGRFRERGIWKIPTGIVDQGEDISVGAKREVLEETGIDTEFMDVLAFRQMHKYFFEKSDLFFLCMLRPLTFDVKNQDSEIAGAQWMPIEEYAAQPLAHEEWMFKDVSDLCLAKLDKNYNGLSPITSFFNDLVSYLYVHKQDLNL